METKEVAEGIEGYFDGLCATVKLLDTTQLAQIVAVLLRAQDEGKTIFTMGNGGHGSTASHMINDIAKHSVSSDAKDCVVTAKRFRTLCLNDSVSLLTGVANDMGYENVFSEQLENWCQPGDVVIGISGSGNSPNVLKAFDVARRLGATSICLSGKGGGKAKSAADICVVVPSGKMVQIEDVHLMINHAVADELKKAVQERTKLAG
jgi:D-sedoheptulose 7-phosphate isomerase